MNDISNDINLPAHKKEIIRQLQQFLRTISASNQNIPLIDVDGIFGKETANAVRAFQKEYGLNVTGIADNQTLDAIYKEYLRVLKLKRPSNALQIFENNEILKPGDESDEVYVIQLMLNSINRRFVNIPPIAVTGKLDDKTINSVNKINEKFGTSPQNHIDSSIWNDLSNLYNAIVVR